MARGQREARARAVRSGQVQVYTRVCMWDCCDVHDIYIMYDDGAKCDDCCMWTGWLAYRYHAPSTIFLDEIDAILSSRGGGDGAGGEHEASRSPPLYTQHNLIEVSYPPYIYCHFQHHYYYTPPTDLLLTTDCQAHEDRAVGADGRAQIQPSGRTSSQLLTSFVSISALPPLC